jgi:hypothetical protein
MPGKVKRITVDLSDYPDLVVVYLGMRVNFLRGLKNPVRVRATNTKRGERESRWSLAPREFHHLPFSFARRHARILARLSVVGSLDAFRAASALVEEISGRLRRHWLLARNLFCARWYGGHLRRRSSAAWLPGFRPVTRSTRFHVQLASAPGHRRSRHISTSSPRIRPPRWS